MRESNLDKMNDDYLGEQTRREAEEKKVRETAKRREVDRVYPPETERSFEELLEAVPSNARQRIERAKSVLEGKEISPADRTSYVADTVELLNRYLSSTFNMTDDQADYSFREQYYGVKHPESEWEIPPQLEIWLGTDAKQPDVQTRVKNAYLNAIKSSYATWLTTARLVRSIFPNEMEGRDQIMDYLKQIRDAESEALRVEEAKRAPEFLAKFPEEIQRVILRETFSVELTEGCSVRCTFCAFDAAGGVRDTMPFETALWILRRIEGRANLHYATDPLDYRSTSSGRDRTFSDILDAFAVLHGKMPFASTAAPIKSMDVLRRVVDRIGRISFSKMNERRLIREGFVEQTDGGTYLPTDNNLAMRFWYRPFGPEGFFPEIFRLTDKENEASPHKVYASGRQGTRAHEEGHANGDAVADSIACRDGVLLSPKKARNSVRMMTTREYPNGIAEAMLEPDRLRNGANEVRRLEEQINEGFVSIEQLLPYVVVDFDVSESRDLKLIDTLSSYNVSLLETIRFKTFRMAGNTAESISGMCEFDRVSGKIRSIFLLGM